MSRSRAARKLVHATGELALDRCLVMGIVNRTPDSFYDGGRTTLEASLRHAVTLVEQGADVLDLGAVPGAPGPPVSEAEELRRLLPLVKALARRVEVPLAVDTGSAEVARRCLEAGASIVNDVTGLADPALAGTAARAALVVMHNGGQIRGRPRHPRYSDVVADVIQTWEELIRSAAAAGMRGDRILVDPGLDFGKTTAHSLELIRRLDELTSFPRPVLLAPSRKDVVGETLDLPPDGRLEGTLALVALAVEKGVSVVRVHDVAATVRVVRTVEAVLGRRPPAAPVRGLWD